MSDDGTAAPEGSKRRLGRVSLVDVVARAKVSHITVSRALHRAELVSPATRARVIEALQHLGYQPVGLLRVAAPNDYGASTIAPVAANQIDLAIRVGWLRIPACTPGVLAPSASCSLRLPSSPAAAPLR